MTVTATPTLKRYLELPYMLQCLHTRSLTLLSPSSWDDKNDSYGLEHFRKRKKLKAVHAACLTGAAQTYHHWRVFTQGASGACIYFRKEPFREWIHNSSDVVARAVDYRTIPQLRSNTLSIDDLPFVKRQAYEPEEEFRILHLDSSAARRTWDMPIELGLIQQVVLNPWLPPTTVKSIREIVNQIEGCKNLKVNRATIVQSDEWQSLAKRAEA